MRTQRAKGKAHEQEVANAIKHLFRGAKRGCAQSRNGRAQEDKKADVECTPYWIECTHGARPSVFDKLEQAKEATDGRLCVAVVKKNRGENIASMTLDDFLHLLHDVEVLRVLRAQPAMEKVLELAEAQLRDGA